MYNLELSNTVPGVDALVKELEGIEALARRDEEPGPGVSSRTRTPQIYCIAKARD
jgi:hypothetical protein